MDVTARLKRLKIVKFRDVRPGTELHFSDGWNVLVGHNATGKTTLLNLISMALRGDFSALHEESFELEYLLQWEGGQEETTIRHVPARRAVPSAEAPSIGGSTDQWMIRLTDLLGTRILANTIQPLLDVPVVIAELPSGDNSPLHLSVALQMAGETRFAMNAHSPSSYRFDEALETFRVLFGDVGEPVGLPDARLRVGVHSAELVYVWTAMIPRFAAWESDAHGGRVSAFRGTFESCRHLSWAVASLGGNGLDAVYPVTGIQVPSRHSAEVDLGPPTFLLRRADGTATSIRNLSFGQRRLFTFAWYLDSNPGPVVADELVNGMHYEWIDHCVRAMEGRQIFVTAQNPLLLDHVPFASAADVTSSFVLCRAGASSDGRREVVWSHPSDAQAAEFFRGYENGILKVHEILRTEGLW